MPIEGINSAMTTLQFARVRSSQRAVEMSAQTNAKAGTSRPFASAAGTTPGILASTAQHRLVAPPTLHWIYRADTINGKRAAKRTPQLADSEYWSFSLNRYG